MNEFFLREGVLNSSGITFATEITRRHCSPKICPTCAQRNPDTNGPGGNFCRIKNLGRRMITLQEMEDIFKAFRPVRKVI